MIKVAINGYGRIGRVAHRVILEKYLNELDVVAINAGKSTDIKGWMYLLKYDTSYGPIYSMDVSFAEKEEDSQYPDLIGYLIIDSKKIPVFSQKDPTLLPWGSLGVDVVIESTGHFTSEEKLKTHLQAGAKAVVLSAPAKEGNVPTVVMGVNSSNFNGGSLVNNASCTTNCIAPVARVIVDAFGVDKAMMTTIHGYTSDQELQDGGHKDYRRARAAGQNIVPTSTGATIAAAEVVPELKGLFAGLSVRVPVVTGSLADFTFVLKRETTKEEVNEALKKASQNPLYSGILAVTEDPIVSTDIIGSSYSSIVDLSLTQVMGNMIKVIAWYDNEYGYANRLVEEVIMMGRKQAQQPQVAEQPQVVAQQETAPAINPQPQEEVVQPAPGFDQQQTEQPAQTQPQ